MVTIKFWPLQAVWEIPLFAVVLFSLFIGLVSGALISWATKTNNEKQSKKLRSELDPIQNRTQNLADFDSSTKTASNNKL